MQFHFHFHFYLSVFLLDIAQCQKIINDHIDHRRIERLQAPERFDIKPSIGERCVRKAVPAQNVADELEDEKLATDNNDVAAPGRVQSKYGALLSFFVFDQSPFLGNCLQRHRQTDKGETGLKQLLNVSPLLFSSLTWFCCMDGLLERKKKMTAVKKEMKEKMY